MKKLEILNAKEIKEMYKLLKRQYGFNQKLDYFFAINSKNKIYAFNKEIFNIKIDNIRLNSLGLYFAEIKGDEIRLSIEGSQIVGRNAAKNIVELNEGETLRLFKGEDLEKETDLKGFVILKCKNDFLGTGKVKGNRILNFVSKTRRIKL